MPEMIRAILTWLVGPAIIGTIFAFILNTRDERGRTLRDKITEAFEETRSDIREAVRAGVAYWNCGDAAKVPELEAQVLLYDSDVRSGLAAIRGLCADEELATVPAIQALEGEFVDALTGGNFGSAPFAADPARARRVIGLGSRLRSELAKLRRHQLGAAKPYAARSAGLFVLSLGAAAITYGAGLFAGLVIAGDSNSAARRHEICSQNVEFRSGSQRTVVQVQGNMRICSRTRDNE